MARSKSISKNVSGTMNKQLKWAPAKPVLKDDNIISSKAREMHEAGFSPSFEKYRRIWFQERAKYEKETYTLQQIIKEESKIKRRFVQRMMTYQKPSRLDIMEPKSLKKSNMQDYKQMKFKPACLKLKESKIQKLNVKDTATKELAKGKGPQKPPKKVELLEDSNNDENEGHTEDILVCEVMD